MAGPTTAAIERDVSGIKDRIARIEQEIIRHADQDREEFAEIRKSHEEQTARLNELKIMISEAISLESRIEVGEKRIGSLEKYQDRHRPWMELLIKLAWAIFGAGVAYIITHGGSLFQ